MHSPKAFLNLIVNQLLKRTPVSILEIMEDKIQSNLGKGWGAWTTDEESRAISSFVKKQKIQQVTALDVGANLGDWSATLFREIPNAKIFAFEPSREAFLSIQSRFAKNTSIQCVNIALGKENSTATLFADESGSGLGSLTKRRVKHFGINFNHEEIIELHTLDTWMERNGKGLRPNVLKMDVEGHELDVLKGASNTLKNIEIIQFEFGGSNIDTRTYFQDFWYFLTELDFRLYRLGPRTPKLITMYSEIDETFRPTNYIAVRKK
jgi:FkbM family methyltransferase